MRFTKNLLVSDEQKKIVVVEVLGVLSIEEIFKYEKLGIPREELFIVAKGVSKCHENDNWNAKMGERIATAKAVKKIRKQYLHLLKDAKKEFNKTYDQLKFAQKSRIKKLEDFLEDTLEKED